MAEITYEITEKDRLKALAAAYKLSMIALRRGDPFPMVRFEWPELIITDPAELEEFGKVIDRPDNRDLRLDDFQVDAVRSVFDQKHTQVRISGGTKLGKGLITGGFIVNLWFDLYDDCKIVLVGPNTDHLKINMFGEAATWRRKMTSYKIGLNVPDVQKEKIEDAKKPTHVIKLANTDSGEGMSGNHSGSTLFSFDEACLDDKSEVLTDSGWKFLADLDGTESVLTMNPENQEAFFERPSCIHKSHRKGKMISCRERGIDVCMTPNHRMPMVKWLSKTKREVRSFMSAEDISAHGRHSRTPCTFSFAGKEIEYYVIPEFNGLRKKFPAIQCNADDWLEFLGWFVSEGCFGFVKGRPYTVSIAQSKPDNRQKIIDCCERLGFKCGVYGNGLNGKKVAINSAQLAYHLLETVGRFSHLIRIPRYVFEVSERQKRVFLGSFLLGDGYVKNSAKVYYTSSRGLADDLQGLILMCGKRVTVRSRGGVGNLSLIEGHVATTRHECWVVTESEPTEIHWSTRAIEEVEYDGMVYCITMPSHGVFFSRRNGMCIWSGNSSAPDEHYMNALSQCKMIVGVSNPRAPSGWFYKGYEAAQFFEGGSMTAMASTGPMRLLSIGAVHCANVKAKRLMNRIAPPGGISINGRDFKQGEVIPIELAKYTDPLIPGQVCYDKCEELKETCSPDEKEWRVFGRFPRSSKLFQIFHDVWKKKLGAKWRQGKERILSRAIGVDVAGSVDGDYTTFAFGNEVGLADLYMMHQPNHAELSGLLAAIARERGLDIFDGSVPTAIDCVGIGKGLADFLEEKGCLVIKVSNGKIAERDTQTYGNRRAEVYGELSIAIDPDVNPSPWLIPDDHQYSDRIWQELIALEKIYMSDGRKWRLTPKRPTPSQRGKAVEDNRQALSEKLGRSPDCADAVSLLYQAVRELPEFEENFALQFDPSAEIKEMLRDSRTGNVEVLFWSGKRELLPAAEYEKRFGKFGAMGNSESWEALKNQVFG